MVSGRTREKNLDHPDFPAMFGTAAKLGIPLFIHPQIPQRAVRDVYYSGFGEAVTNEGCESLQDEPLASLFLEPCCFAPAGWSMKQLTSLRHHQAALCCSSLSGSFAKFGCPGEYGLSVSGVGYVRVQVALF
jgi:hypothetical protein